MEISKDERTVRIHLGTCGPTNWMKPWVLIYWCCNSYCMYMKELMYGKGISGKEETMSSDKNSGNGRGMSVWRDHRFWFELRVGVVTVCIRKGRGVGGWSMSVFADGSGYWMYC